jgi:hypothetical protein
MMSLFDRKGQSELLGMVMVVFLISLGLIFVISFMLLTGNDDPRASFVQKELAINVNNAMLDTQTTCRGIPVVTLLKDCAETQRLRCGGVSSCDYVDSVLVEMLNSTLYEWGFDYSYLVYTEGLDSKKHVKIKIPGDFNCPGDVTPGIFFIPIKGGTLYSELRICG